MNEIKTTLGRGGRLNLPAEHRRALGLSEGDEVLIGVDGGAIRIQTREAAIDRVQHMVRERLGEGRSPSEELIAERREEARREDALREDSPEDGEQGPVEAAQDREASGG